MKRLLLPIVCSALFTTACGQVDALLPDGGKPRRSCTEESPSLAVKVVDNQGTAWADATVHAVNAASGKEIDGQTDGAGINRSINGDIGTGTVRIHAHFGNRESAVTDVQWVCGDCNCVVQPGNITLVIP